MSSITQSTALLPEGVQMTVPWKFLQDSMTKGVLVVAMAFLFGCADSSAPTKPADTPPKVALIMKSLANEFFVNMQRAAEAHQAERTDVYTLVANGIKNESDLAQQVALVDQMIARGVDAIVIAPADSRALVPALVRAIQAGIHVVNIDNRLAAEVLAEYEANIPYIGPSNREGARLVAEYVLAKHDAGSEVFVLEGIPTAANAKQRKAGFEDAIAAADMALVDSQSGAWDQTLAAQITAAVLNRYPNLRVILAANDNMALGAASAANLADRDDLTIAGFDNISAVHPLMREGRIEATVEQYGAQFAIFGIEFALEMIAGNTEMLDRTTAVKLVTPADLDQ